MALGTMYAVGVFNSKLNSESIFTAGQGILYSDNAGSTWNVKRLVKPSDVVAGGSIGAVATLDGTHGIAAYTEPSGGSVTTHNRYVFVFDDTAPDSLRVDISAQLSDITLGKGCTPVKIQYSPESSSIAWALYSSPLNTGIKSVLLYTSNGGATWTKILTSTAVAGSFQFIDGLNGWIAFKTNSGLVINRTFDGGTNWINYSTKAEFTDIPIDLQISKQYPDVGVILGHAGQIVRTKDAFIDLLDFGLVAGSNQACSALCVAPGEASLNKNYFFVSQGTFAIKYSYLTDDGENWGGSFTNAIIIGGGSFFTKIKSKDGFIIIAATDDGRIYKASNGGANGLFTGDFNLVFNAGYFINDIAIPVLIDCTIKVTSVTTNNAINNTGGSATINVIGAAPGGSSLEFGISPFVTNQPWQQPTVWQSGINFNNLASGDYLAWVRVVGFETTCIDAYKFTIGNIENLAANATKTDVTVNGGSDGTITVNVTNGSGNYTVTFVYDNSSVNLSGNNPQTTTKSGLQAGAYTINVHDLVTDQVLQLHVVINEPIVIPPPDGTKLEVPFLNSLSFVIEQSLDNCDNPQGLDNTLFCEQTFKGFTQPIYYQKLAKCDKPIIQFNSDYPNHSARLIDYITQEVVKTFSVQMVEQNLNKEEQFNVTIRNHTQPGQSRVYFNSGTPPIPLSKGDSFEIANNADGFNGMYAIADIITDTLLGYQYLVINKNYSLSETTSSASAIFVHHEEDFNVFEFAVDVLDVSNGIYYVQINAINPSGLVGATAVSEPIDIQVEHEGTCLIKYRNTDNAFGITWTTGYIGLLRVESLFGHKRFPGGDRTVSRNSDYSLVKVSAKKQRVLLFETFMLPPYLHEKLSVVFDCDSLQINSIPVQTLEGYAEPSYLDRFLLSNSSIKVEQIGWFDKYNSDDIGTISDQGFIIANEGFLKR